MADKESSYWLAKLLPSRRKYLKKFFPIWNKRRPVSNDKSFIKLGMKRYKTLKDSVLEMAWALVEFGIAENKTKMKEKSNNELERVTFI